jgi:cytoskeleton protein RodZ
MDENEYVSTPELEPTAVVPSLGLLLRKAREARGLSIEDVVHALKFSARQIEAVEADRLDVMPSSVFLRGLIRSYSRFLKLDPEPLLGLLGTSATVLEPDIRAPENMGNAAPRGGFHQIPPLVAVSILLLIAAAAMTGWHLFGTGMPQMQRLDGSPRAIIEELKPVPATQTAAPAPVVAAAAPFVPMAGASSEIVQPSATTQPVVLPTDMRRLSFDFHGESWIEVKDASGLVILTGLYTGGNHSVAGRPPFEVVIGNAAAVTLLDNGHPVDLKPNTRAEVARLTLE